MSKRPEWICGHRYEDVFAGFVRAQRAFVDPGFCPVMALEDVNPLIRRYNDKYEALGHGRPWAPKPIRL